MKQFNDFQVLTFDCYGTLIDWERGIVNALKPVLAKRSIQAADDEILQLYGKFESAAEHGPFRNYRLILQDVLRRFAEHFEFDAAPEEIAGFPNSLGDWPAFPDTVEALRALSENFKLAIISNVDDDLFALSQKRLKVNFDWIITAQQVSAYKPSHQNFEFALQKIGFPKTQILHVAQSLFHDHVPAKELGFSTVWIDRRAGKSGAGATPPAEAKPDWEFPDLKSFAEATQAA